MKQSSPEQLKVQPLKVESSSYAEDAEMIFKRQCEKAETVMILGRPSVAKKYSRLSRLYFLYRYENFLL